MALQETLTADLKTAMLNRDAETVSVLRMVQAAFKYAEIAGREAGTELTEEDLSAIVRKEVKKRTESASTYRAAGHEDRAAAEEAEAELLKKYLPAAADTEAVRAFLAEEASKIGSLEPRHRGELIRSAMAKFPGQLDGKVAADIVSSLY